jgi:chromosome segregation ATPase
MFLEILFKHKSSIFALNICIVSFALLPLLSCTAAIQNNKSASGQVWAENSMMKKRLSLIERESDVLKKENQQRRTKIQELETENKQLGLELTSLNEKYLSDMTNAEEQINYLQETLEKREKENSDRTDALLSDNKALEKKRIQENHALQEQIVMQKAAFNQERELKMQESAKRELSFSSQLGVLNKKLEEKDSELSALKLAISEITAKLDAANTLSQKLTKARDESLAELESVKASNSDLNKKITELRSTNGK